MVMLDLAPGWTVELDRGPNWVFAKLHGAECSEPSDLIDLADKLSSLLDQEFVNRLVVEMDDVPMMRSHMIGELVRLRREIQDRGGVMRFCGLSEDNWDVLRRTRLHDWLPLYRDRTEAVMGCDRPKQPRQTTCLQGVLATTSW